MLGFGELSAGFSAKRREFIKFLGSAFRAVLQEMLQKMTDDLDGFKNPLLQNP